MKYMNIIKLLSVLLCIGMLFVACNDNDGNEDGTKDTETVTETETETETGEDETAEVITEEPLLENVEPVFDNFFELLGEETGEIESAERIDGEVAGNLGNRFFIIKSTDIDTANTVKETYKLYNIDKGEVTLTLENTYFNGDYDVFDWNNIMVTENMVHEIVNDGSGTSIVETDMTKRYPESVMKVEFVTYDEGADVMPLVKVSNAEVTPIDEETRLENPDGCVYEIEVTVTYYDVMGNLVTSIDPAYDGGHYEKTGQYWSIGIGNTVAYFDGETFELVRTTTLDDTGFRGGFARENEYFGYYDSAEEIVIDIWDNMDDVYRSEDLTCRTRYLDIYNKITGETARYYYDSAYRFAQPNYLHNGDVLIQYTNPVEKGEPFDYYEIENGVTSYYTLAHVMLDVETGTMTEISLPYYIARIMTAEEFSELKSFEDKGVGVKDNARNIAYVNAIADKALKPDREIVVFDNDMSVLYSLERIVPEHSMDKIGELGFEILPNGDRLVALDNIVTDRAIVKADGTVRSYLKAGMEIAGDYVVYNNVIYDYDLNAVYDMAENGYEYVRTVFGSVLFAEPVDQTAVITGPECRTYYTLTFETVDGQETATAVAFFVGAVEIIGESTDDYVIVRDSESGKYTLYNESMEEVLVTYNQMTVNLFESGYIVSTDIQDEDYQWHTLLYYVK